MLRQNGDARPSRATKPGDDAAMSQAASVKVEAPATQSTSERLVDQLANRIGGLGVELADIAGNVQEVANRVTDQSARFGHLQKTA